MKLIADNHRYISEMSRGDRNQKALEEAKKVYEEAQVVPLQPCTPTKLSLTLNISVFYYEVLKDQKQAIAIADQALTSALEKIDDLGEEEFKDAKIIIDQLKENLSVWKEEEEEKNKPIEQIK